MDAKEYDLWVLETKKSERRWVFDEVMARNNSDNELLWYKGGAERGVFIWAHKDGTVDIGYYEGAIPSITDAMFKTEHSKKCGPDVNQAARYALERMGMEGLFAMVFPEVY